MPGCATSYNPYDYSIAVDKSCGDVIVPLTSKTARDDHGLVYKYENSAGSTITIAIPPRGFNPLAASVSQRFAYGIPPRPSDPAKDAAWATTVKRLKWTSPPDYLAMTKAQAGVSNPNAWSDVWAGYAALNGSYASAVVGYVEPAIGGSCGGSAEVTWGGLGGLAWDNSNFVEQDGTAWGVPGLGAHQAWWEIWPTYYMAAMNVSAHPGDLISANTHYVGAAHGVGVFQFTVTDYTTGATQSVEEAAVGGDSFMTAEGVVERPTIGTEVPPLANVGSVHFWPVVANGQPLNSFNLADIAMLDGNPGSRVLAAPSALTSNTSYSVSYAACS